MSSDPYRKVSNDGTVWIWDTKTGDQMVELQGHDQAVCSIAYSLNGGCIVSGSKDRTVWIWDAETGHSVLEL